MVEGVETAVDLEMALLGPMALRRRGAAVHLPASRKVRALLAYLTLAPHPVSRNHLCELLWELPNDPRGELRWSLSKLRGILEEPSRRRIVAEGDTVRLELGGCRVDALEIASAAAVIDTLPVDRLRELVALFGGDLLDGLEMDRNPLFESWLVAQRRRFRGWHAVLLERLVHSAGDDEALGFLERWVQLSPFDRRVHELLLHALVRHNRLRDGEEHLHATVRLFEEEGLDCAPLREAWRQARNQRPAATAAANAAPLPAASPRRASIAVMPFMDVSRITSARGGVADALAHDVITRLAKLRSLFVIAQGTVFALHERQIGADRAGRMLNVDYVAAGTARSLGSRLIVSIELVETRTARIVWTETFDRTADDAFAVLDDIGNSIVASIASEIEASERNRAVLIAPSSLDAWEAHHRGLWHMYRFSKTDNDLAQHFFELAIRLDPTFARAYAGLSFTHFQNAFQGWTPRGPEIDHAFAAAAQSIMADDRDPAAHWAVGRALWLRGQVNESVAELETAVDLSPNFALGHYTLSFVHSQTGDPEAAISASDYSRHLSPFDPLLFGMLGARAMALIRLGRFDEAAEWGMKAAARPNAHAHIQAIAAYALALAERPDEARRYLSAIRRALPNYRVDDFLTAMQFAPADERVFRDAARTVAP